MQRTARVKAYRKQVREGMLRRVLLCWVSGLGCHLILDGHARLASAIAESVEPPLGTTGRHPRSPSSASPPASSPTDTSNAFVRTSKSVRQ